LPSDGTDYQSLPNAVVALLPTPVTEPLTGNGHARNLGKEVALLPTPAVNDMGAAYTPETWDEWTASMKARHNNGNGHGKSLNVEAQRLTVCAFDPPCPNPVADVAMFANPNIAPAPACAEHLAAFIDPRLLPTPTVQDGANNGGPSQFERNTRPLNTEVLMLPTPRATDGTKGGPNQRGSSGDLMLPSAVSQLLPTPTAQDSASSGGNPDTTGTHGTTLTDATVRQPARWGEYEPAIRRWEALTRPAPEPTKLNSKGKPKLSDEFDEWLMGFPKGWITDVPGVTWNEVLKACGNGVVWQQGAAGLRYTLELARWSA
jgi:DNA (cytosine-5)-methyltransferase 1